MTLDYLRSVHAIVAEQCEIGPSELLSMYYSSKVASLQFDFCWLRWLIAVDVLRLIQSLEWW